MFATGNMLSWSWLLNPCLHLETGSQFVAIKADAQGVTIRTCKNKSLQRQHCHRGLCSHSRFCVSAGSSIMGFAFTAAEDLHICGSCIVGFASDS